MAHVATITIDHTKVPGDLTDYVGLIVPDGSAGYSALYALCLEGGGDIRLFKSDDTTELAREIVSFSVSAETGEIHYRYAGTLSSSVDTDIHVYADGSSSEPSASATYGSEAVWPDYKGVYHFAEGTGTTLKDSTGNFNGTLSNSALWDTDTKIGSASLDFSAGDFYASLCELNIVSDITIQHWLKQGTRTGDRHWGIFQASPRQRFLCDDNTTGYRPQEERSGTTFHDLLWSNPTTWVMLHTVSEKNAHLRLYTDGSLEQQESNENSDWDFNGLNFVVGALNNGGNFVDYSASKHNTFRVRLTALSANWITTEYNNQNSPSTFYSVAAVGGGSTPAQAARRGVIMMM